MTMYVLYAKPLDYPDEFVCRRHLASANLSPSGLVVTAVETTLFARAPSLEELREKLPEHLVNIGRQEEDDWAIAEVWI